MYVRQPPMIFLTGSTLSPRDINENLNHARVLIDRAQASRHITTPFRIPLQASVSAPYTNASSAAVRTFKVRFPSRVTVERAYFRWYGLGTADVTITRNGADWLTITPDAADSSKTAFSGERIVLDAAATYTFVVTGSAFTSKNSYLELHLRSDRFNTAGDELAVPYVPLLVSGGEARDATKINANLAAIDAAVDSITGAGHPMRADVFVLHAMSSESDVRTWHLPTGPSAGQRRLVATYVVTELDDVAHSGPTGFEWAVGAATSVSAQVGGGDSSSAVYVVLGTPVELTGAVTVTASGFFTPDARTVDKAYLILVYA